MTHAPFLHQRVPTTMLKVLSGDLEVSSYIVTSGMVPELGGKEVGRAVDEAMSQVRNGPKTEVGRAPPFIRACFLELLLIARAAERTYTWD